jgi:CDP-diacylglycerol---serine O-phosphatidyltransferase
MGTMAEQQSPEPKGGFRRIPVRYLLPNLITLLALCSGVTAIRFGIEGKTELAVAAIILAGVLDAVDGRLARYLEGTSKFGAELDSLADFVNFGVVPSVLLYFWGLNSLGTIGWFVSLMLAIACALRLARFNVALEDPSKPAWASNYFTGVPAPAGAALALVPFYLDFLNIIESSRDIATFVAIYVFAVAALMVSRVPTYSGKSFTRIEREWVIPVLAVAAMTVVALVSFPWETLSIAAALYILLIPISVRGYLRNKRRDAESVPAGEAKDLN